MTERLRVLQVAPYLHPHVGGVESHVEAVSLELAARGHDVEVLTTRLPGSPATEMRHGYRVTRVPPLGILFNTPITPRARGVVEASTADVVHAHSPPPLTAYYAARGVAASGAPFVLTHHCDLEIPLPGGGFIVETYRRTLGRATVTRAHAVIATTRTYAATSRSLWSRRDVDVIPNAVDAERFHPGVDASVPRERHSLGERPVALFVGRLAPHKGVEELVRAAHHTAEDVVHLIVGDGPRRQALERLARQQGVEEKVVFAGKVDYRDLPAYYAAASVGVLPSTSRLEAFGIAALEAMATARPVVASNIPGVAEVIAPGETGLLAEPLDARDLAAQIDAVAGDPERAREMGKRARERVLASFTVPAVVDRLEAVYKRVLDAEGVTAGARARVPGSTPG